MVITKWFLLVGAVALFIWVIYSWGYSDGYEDATEEALKKQIPKKPTCQIYKSENIYLGTSKTYFCPRCNSIVWLSDKHCPECGQAIDWSE